LTLGAQAPRPVLAPGNTVLLAQYECAADQLSRADAIFNQASAPILNKYVASGKVISWGYMGVYLGGKANRTIYLWASDPVALMQARQSYLPEIMTHPSYAEFGKICGAATITLNNLITLSNATTATK
jgi:hypothetical protein